MHIYSTPTIATVEDLEAACELLLDHASWQSNRTGFTAREIYMQPFKISLIEKTLTDGSKVYEAGIQQVAI